MISDYCATLKINLKFVYCHHISIFHPSFEEFVLTFVCMNFFSVYKLKKKNILKKFNERINVD